MQVTRQGIEILASAYEDPGPGPGSGAGILVTRQGIEILAGNTTVIPPVIPGAGVDPMASVVEIDLVVKVDGVVLPNCEIHYRSTRDEIIPFKRDQEDGGYAAMPEDSLFSAVNDLLLRTDKDNTLVRVDGQITGQIHLNANGFVLIVNGLIDDVLGRLVKVQYSPGDSSVAKISGFIAGT